MSPMRTFGLLALIVAGVAFGAFMLTHELHDLHTLQTTTRVRTTHSRASRHRGVPTSRRTSRPALHHTRRRHRRRLSMPSTTTASSSGHGSGPFGLPHVSTLTLVGAEIVGGIVLVAVVLMLLVGRRMRHHRERRYELYELHLSAHDQAKPQDLEDMVEQIANTVRVFPAERIRDGQPSVAMELICGQDPQGGMYWSINLRCLPDMVRALDAAISAAYPDVRVGHQHDDKPVPRPGALREPGCVMRFRKERSFVYPLLSSSDEQASPPLEQIARAQIELDQPSIVRFSLTPTPSFFEEYARRLYRRHENKLARQEHWGLPEGGLRSTLNRSEMADAQRTQNRSLFWLEAVIAADTMQTCKTVAAAVQSRRGENRLHRRWMVLRAGLYRRRFAQVRGPLVPSARSLVSAAEVAHLLELPTARMKGVPVQRQMLPRIPAPADCQRCTHPTRGERPRRRPRVQIVNHPAGDPDAITAATVN